jgi:hypothetical protein
MMARPPDGVDLPSPEFLKLFLEEWLLQNPIVCPDCKKPVPIPEIRVKSQ